MSSNEHTNFTYDLTELNKAYLACVVALIGNVSVEETHKYIRELEEDENLRMHIKNATLESERSFVADTEARYGKRLGWYALIRARKPKIVVESGVDKGLGSCVITAALLRNSDEGYPGYMYGIDINPSAGYLLQEPYSKFGEIIYGDSIKSLKKMSCHIDLFINDSDHSSEYEMKEYQIIGEKLCEDSLIIGDNSHCTDELYKFAMETGRMFIFFKEQPKDHWYAGGGMGVAFNLRGKVPVIRKP